MPSDPSHNPKVHLNLAGDNPEDPRVLRVTVKQSKKYPLRKEGKTSSDLQQC